jgi:hypothetical protein
MSSEVVRSSPHLSSAVYGEASNLGNEHTLVDTSPKLTDNTIRLCPHCHRSYSPGELICAYCGIPFVNMGKTNKIESHELDVAATKNWPIGEVSAQLEKPITFQCGDQALTMPVVDSVTVGRLSKVQGDPQPDIKLNLFGAEEKGVSRQHIKIIRKQDLLYVADLGSSNGTFLNGRPLVRNCLRLLRHGDELQLGLLKMQIRFE